jgi:hypothetical protein
MKTKINLSNVLNLFDRFLNKRKCNLWFTTISLLYLSKVINFIQRNPQFYYYWDWQGHIDKALKLSWLPWQAGWDNSFWGGYSTLTYPNLSHYLLKIFLLVPDEKLALILYTVLIFTIQLYAFYLLSKINHNQRIRQMVVFGLLIFVSLNAEGKYLGSYLGTLTAGGFSANLGLSLLIFLISATNLYHKTLLIGALLLTHSLTGFVGLIYYSFYLINQAIVSKGKKRLTVHLLIAPVIAIGIASPWIIPYIDPAFKGASENIASNKITFSLLSLLYLSVLKILRKYFGPFESTLLVLAILLALPTSVIISLKNVGISGLHLYRFEFILILFIMATSWHQMIHPKLLTHRYILSLVLVGIVITSWFQSIPKRNLIFDFDDKAIANLEGRIMNTSSINAIPDNPHVLEEVLTRKNPKILGTQGLFYESSSRGLQFYELANQIQPSTFKNGTYGIFFNNPDGKPWNSGDIFHTAQLLGINYVVYVDAINPQREYGQVIGKVLNNNEPRFDIVIEKFEHEYLIESISSIPEVKPKQNLGTWWLETDHKELYTLESIDMKTDQLDLSKPPVHIVNVSPTSILLSIESQQPVPVIVKFTHNKYLSAKTIDLSSTTTKPIWISPGNIFLVGNGKILLQWHTPYYMFLVYFLSGISITYATYKGFTFQKNRGVKVTPLLIKICPYTI